MHIGRLNERDFARFLGDNVDLLDYFVGQFRRRIRLEIGDERKLLDI